MTLRRPLGTAARRETEIANDSHNLDATRILYGLVIVNNSLTS
jgi:hypothetical protein